MKTKLVGQAYDTCLETSDWRHSAAIVGLIQYFEDQDISYQVKGDCLYYNEEDLTEESYLMFVEHFYGEKLHHIVIENMLQQQMWSEEQMKLINEKLKGNTVLKKVMKGITFDGTNAHEILKQIEKHRQELIKETFRNKNEMYKNYCNTNALFTVSNDSCRLVGYNIDFAKKGKSASYQFDKENFIKQDGLEMDFIPFAFLGARESFFINDNLEINELMRTYKQLKNSIEIAIEEGEKIDARKILFKCIIETEGFLSVDVEIISKSQEKDYYETLYIRKQALKVLKTIKKDYEIFCFSVKVTDQYWINVQKKVLECILNHLRTDELIELFLKKREREYVVSKLIYLNKLIQGGGIELEKRTKMAYGCAKEVAKRLPENKLSTYKQKLTSAIVFHDYDRVCEILLQLSNYAEVSFDFAYDLFENFEANKDIAYSFINALSNKKVQKDGEGAN